MSKSTAEFDWNAISTIEGNIWVVGKPGCVIVHSNDYGKSWNEYRTSETTPLHSVFFLNKDRGWAVGDLGKILATKDGGQSWATQRNSGNRLAILNFTDSPSDCAIETLCLLSGSFGNLGGVVLCSDAASDTSNQTFTQLANRVGVSAVSNLHIDSTGSANNSSGEREWYKRIVRSIRQWKPSIIIVDQNNFRLLELVSKSVDLAALSTEFSQHSELGLAAWKVEKVISTCDPDLAEKQIAIDQFSAMLGRPVSEQTKFARMLQPRKGWNNIETRLQGNEKIGWDLVKTSIATNVARTGITSGTRCQFDPKCNRPKKKLEIDNMQAFQSISKRKQNIERLLQYQIDSPIEEKNWLEGLTAATSGMDEISLAFFLQELSLRYTDTGKPDLSDMTERYILQRVPQSEVADQSLLRLINRYGSYESNRLLKNILSNKIDLQPKSRVWDPKVKPASFHDPLLGNTNIADAEKQELAKKDFEAGVKEELTASAIQNGLILINTFQNQFPTVSTSSEIEFKAARTKLLSGNRTAIDRLIDSNTTKPTSSDPWLQRIYRERLIRKLDEQYSIDHLACQSAKQSRIILDGFFNEPIWKQTTGNQPAIQFAYDREYLYVAIRQKLISNQPAAIPTKRNRDDDLSGFQRLALRIDIDRDYTSAYEFVVDQRGCCRESIWRDPNTNDHRYNPKWYVASSLSKSHWMAEIAIPIKELTEATVDQGTAWVIDYDERDKSTTKTNEFRPKFEREQLLLFR